MNDDELEIVDEKWEIVDDQQPMLIEVTPHDWEPVVEGAEKSAERCTICGVIRIVVRKWLGPISGPAAAKSVKTVRMYSYPCAALDSSAWYNANPPCYPCNCV